MYFRLLKQMFKFSLVGGMSAVLDFSVYFTLTRGVPAFRTYYVAASVLSSIGAIAANYLINRRWTFNDQHGISIRQYSKYFTVYGLGVLWHNSLLVFFVEAANVHDLIAKVMAVFIVGYGWNFLLAKFWVFRYNRAIENPNN